jgi:hypothetical protein
MIKRKLAVAWIVVLLAIGSCGCSLLSAILSAGITYGIYKASSK